ncbi:autophagy-related protein 13-domain-containing protein [Dipodascopsis uninucleata]
MSSQLQVAQDPGRSAKVDQIVQNLYNKAIDVVVQARSTQPRISVAHRKDKWFNLEVEDTIDGPLRDDILPWRSGPAEGIFDMGPLVLDVVLDTRDLGPNQVLVVIDRDGTRHVVQHRDERVVLERWTFDLRPIRSSAASFLELPGIYKRAVVLFRSLYTYVRILPTWRLRKRLTKSKLAPIPLRIVCVVASKFSATPITALSSTYTFRDIETPVGGFGLAVAYRSKCDFRVDDSESLLSSHFINLDERRHQRHQIQPAKASSLTGSPSSLTSSSSSYPRFSSFHQRSTSRRASISPVAAMAVAASAAGTSVVGGGMPSFLSGTSYSKRQSVSGGGASVSSAKYAASTGISSQSVSGFRPASAHSSHSTHSANTGQVRFSPSPLHEPHQFVPSVGGGSGPASTSPTVPRLPSDDEELGEFVRLMDSRRPLKLSAATSPNSLARPLSRFQQLRDSHAQLSDSISASVVLPAAPHSASSHSRSPSLSSAQPPQTSASPRVVPSAIQGNIAIPETPYGLSTSSRLGSTPRTRSSATHSVSPVLARRSPSTSPAIQGASAGGGAAVIASSVSSAASGGSASSDLQAISGNQHSSVLQSEDDEVDDDELVFAMSDMVAAAARRQ